MTKTWSHTVAIYSRVSTDRQTTENQERELREIATRMGWGIMNVYRDEGVSGAKSRAERPAFNALWEDATRRRFDMVMAWSVDRLGRSLQDLVAFLSELHALRIDLYLHQQGVDTSTPAGKALFQMMGVFAEFERAMIRERVESGLERAKAQGKKLGRPPNRPPQGSGNPSRFARRQGRYHQTRGSPRRRRRHGSADQGESKRLGLEGEEHDGRGS